MPKLAVGRPDLFISTGCCQVRVTARATRLFPTPSGQPSRAALGSCCPSCRPPKCSRGVTSSPIRWPCRLGAAAGAAVRDAENDPSRQRQRLFIALRTRFAEDALTAAVARGVRQLVVVRGRPRPVRQAHRLWGKTAHLRGGSPSDSGRETSTARACGDPGASDAHLPCNRFRAGDFGGRPDDRKLIHCPSTFSLLPGTILLYPEGFKILGRFPCVSLIACNPWPCWRCA